MRLEEDLEDKEGKGEGEDEDESEMNKECKRVKSYTASIYYERTADAIIIPSGRVEAVMLTYQLIGV